MPIETKRTRTRKTKTGRIIRGPYKSHKGQVDHANNLIIVLGRLRQLVGSRSSLPDDPIERKRNEADIQEAGKLIKELSGLEHYNIKEVTGI